MKTVKIDRVNLGDINDIFPRTTDKILLIY